MTDLSIVHVLVEKLRAAGARGTNSELVYAFGMQFNPEVPDTDARKITLYLKAFLCLYDWLEREADIDYTRRLTPYIDAFPVDYIRKVISFDYWPDMNTLIADYLQANPTRNRALDMLPLFTHINEKLVRESVDDDRGKTRPTFHYRLPNCETDHDD
jgi:hypothetical protein